MSKRILSFDEFLTENDMKSAKLFNVASIGYIPALILEGGAAGHMMHPFDDNSLTFGDFKKIVDGALQGKLDFEEQPTEKTDGQNLFVTIKDGKAHFARNKGQMISPIDLRGITNMFSDHPSGGVRDTFTLAAQDLASALEKLKDQSVFNDGKSFINLELIYSSNANVINYDRDVIQFHGVSHTDGEGNIINVDGSLAPKIVKQLESIKAHIQNTFTIIPPQILKIAKDVNFDDRVNYYYKKIEALKKVYNLQDTDEVSRYHDEWWKNLINKDFSNLTDDVKHGLLLRWAYNDKKTLGIKDIKKMVDDSQMKAIKDYDSPKNIKAKQKENMRPFEDLFLELGSDVLKNVANFVAANPKKEMQRLHTQIRSEASKIKKNGDLSQIERVERELARLERIGGVESIMPTEGLVFKLNGKLFKLTGTFAAINQLMGIIKYGR